MARGFGLQGADKAERLQYRAVFIPKNARLVPGPSGCAVYAYTASDGSPALMAFRGSSGRPELHYRFKTEERRQVAIAGFIASVQDQQQRKAARATVKAAWVNPLKAGQILYTSWGYDQTNVEYFIVTRVSGRRVWIREIAGDSESIGFMQDRTWPAMPIRMVGDETMHIAQPSGERGVHITVDSVRTAWPDEGRTHSTSSYA